MKNTINRWSRNMTLREAFARSVNTVFARLSLDRLKLGDLKEYAIRFGFNQDIQSDLPFDPGFTEIPDEKNFRMAEMASGFNKITRMSPIQGAMIAASIAEDGVMRVPYIVDRVTDDQGKVLFQSEPVTAAVTMSKDGAQRLKELMEETVTHGTGRKSFRQLVRDRKFEELEMGGKTGSLYGDNPRGKVDWFVGYAISDKQKLAIAAITVNREKWTVKSTYLAQSIFRKHFGPLFTKNSEKFMSASVEKN
jgi:penicillin-binding protein A